MSLNHGINTNISATNFVAVEQGTVGIPFVIGTAPVHQTEGGYTGVPQIAYNFEEAKKTLGYSDNWETWTLCEAMYTHFKLFGASPVVFMNIYDPGENKKAVSPASLDVIDHVVTIDDDAIIDDSLVVLKGEDTLVKGTDYEAYYNNGKLVIEMLKSGSAYSEKAVNVGYNKADITEDIYNTAIEAIEKIEECKARFGLVPDLISAPGLSENVDMALAMSAKAPSINGLFRAKAVIDLDTTSASDYDEVGSAMNKNGYDDENMIVCWPLAKSGDKVIHMSTIVCGVIATTDNANENVPSESPSNKNIPISGCVNAKGEEVLLTIQQADKVSFTDRVVTALNFGGWNLWGNYTATSSNDVAKCFICTSRMMDYLCNSFVNSYWSFIDKPLTRVLIDAILNSFNAWLAGLAGTGKIYGGEIAYVDDNNPTADLLAGKFRLDTSMASPVPAQRIDMFVEFDVDTLTEALTESITG